LKDLSGLHPTNYYADDHYYYRRGQPPAFGA